MSTYSSSFPIHRAQRMTLLRGWLSFVAAGQGGGWLLDIVPNSSKSDPDTCALAAEQREPASRIGDEGVRELMLVEHVRNGDCCRIYRAATSKAQCFDCSNCGSLTHGAISSIQFFQSLYSSLGMRSLTGAAGIANLAMPP